MCKKLIFLVALVLVFGLVSSTSAEDDIFWDDGDPCDHLWSSPLNWNPDGVPVSINPASSVGDAAHVDPNFTFFGGEYPLIDDSVIKADPNTGSFALTIIIGAWEPGESYATMTGGYLHTDWEFILGMMPGCNGTLNMSGGMIELAGTELFFGTCGSTGTLNMTGGVIDTNFGPLAMPGTLDWYTCKTSGASGHINLDGGTIIAGSIDMQAPSTIDVNGGTLIIEADYRAAFAEYVDKGWITGSDEVDPRYVSIDYNDACDLTIVTYEPNPDYNLPWRPVPGVGERTADWKPTLSWQPGQYAATHTVYFGSSQSDVNAGATPVSVNQVDTTYTDPNYLEFGQRYYWRIDEVNDPCVWPGAVWFFTVNYVSVDNFDPYLDQASLRGTWGDGSTNNTGSTVEVETDITRSGRSVKFAYDNSVKHQGNWMGSEIEADAADPNIIIDANWTPSDAKALALYFYGQPGNEVEATEQMYVALEDGSGNVAVKDYPRDMNDIKIAEWQQWNIKLQDFVDINSINLANVTKVYIGFGDRFNPVSGGSGTVYFDDIEVHPTRCVDEFAPAADVTGECLVDYADFDALAGDWLVYDYNIVATAPNSNGLVGWWKLDEGEGTTALDSAGSNPGTHGGSFPLTWFNDPCRGWVLDFEEVGYVDIPSEAFANVNDEITVTLWQYGDTEMPLKVYTELFHATDACEPYDLTIKGEFYNLSAEGCEVFFDAGYGGTVDADSVSGLAIPENYQGQWNHYAYTKNANTGEMKIYLNGVLFADQGEDILDSPMTGTEITLFKLGSDADDTSDAMRYDGRLSDVRLYNYALSYGEVRYVAGIMDDLYIPLPNPEVDLYLDGKVNFKDYVVLANDWLVETLWP